MLATAYMGMADNQAALYRGQLEPVVVQTTWTTHPYWGDGDFHKGSISFDGVRYDGVPLRYNMMSGQLVVGTAMSKLAIVPDQQRIEWFEIDGQRFVREKECFMRVEYQGRNTALLLQRTKEDYGEVAIDHRAYRDIKAVDRYYLRLPDGTLHEVSKLKTLKRAVPQCGRQLKQTVRTKHLRFSKDTRAASLIACTEAIDGMVKGNTPQAAKPAVAKAPMRTADSLMARVAPVERVAAWDAYTPGGSIHTAYGAEQATATMPGITPVGAMRESVALREVEVRGARSKHGQQQDGVEMFRPEQMRNIPLAMGEADVLKIATKLPGVSAIGEFASGINVRGGAAEHTQIRYNGNTLFNPMHMFGLFSAIDPDLVGETELYKGAIPSQYGGRLSSVMNVKGRMPDMKTFHGAASIGLVTSRAVLEVPIVKDRVSLLVGGRATYSDWMLKLIKKDEEDSYGNKVSSYRDGKANYWDIGATLRSLLSDNHTLLINGYYSHDRFSLNKQEKYGYANMNFSAELRSHYSERLSTVVNAGYDHYNYRNDDITYPSAAARLSFDLNQYFVKALANYQLTDQHKLNMGGEGRLYHILPGSYQPIGASSYIVGRKLTDDNAAEAALWMEDQWAMMPRLTLTGGLRLNVFHSSRETTSHTYFAPDVRLSANYLLDDNASLKLGFNTMHQFIHKVSNTVIMSPTDTWRLSNAQIKPQKGWQLSAGYYLQFANKEYEFSAEAYYKGISDYLVYRSAAQLVMNEQLEKDVAGATGRAYGLELQIRKYHGRLNGWLSYTFARTQLKQSHAADGRPINQGRWFNADYDSPHNIKFVGNYKFTRRYSTSINAEYSTGRPFTAPVAIMPNESGNYSVPVYSDRNAFRMPDYFRIDWAFNIEPSHHITNRTHSWFTIGVYNVLGRRNVYSIYFEGDRGKVNGRKISIFGAPIPYINYNIKF